MGPKPPGAVYTSTLPAIFYFIHLFSIWISLDFYLELLSEKIYLYKFALMVYFIVIVLSSKVQSLFSFCRTMICPITCSSWWHVQLPVLICNSLLLLRSTSKRTKLQNKLWTKGLVIKIFWKLSVEPFSCIAASYRKYLVYNTL